jgi:hypothetical protein
MRDYYQKHLCRFIWISAWVLTAAFMFSDAALAQTTAFTYQGRLSDNRLRITIRDTASAVGPGAFYLFLKARIDGSFISSPTNFRVINLSSYDNLFSSRNSTVRNTFTTVGYANGIAAGTHTFTTTYTFQVIDTGGTYTCNREPDAYLIEIEEVPYGEKL